MSFSSLHCRALSRSFLTYVEMKLNKLIEETILVKIIFCKFIIIKILFDKEIIKYLFYFFSMLILILSL